MLRLVILLPMCFLVSLTACLAAPAPLPNKALQATDLIPILRRFDASDCGAEGEFFGAAGSASEWQTLREQLALYTQSLPDDWAMFGRERVVAFCGACACYDSGIALAVTTEEGVDVITLTLGAAKQTSQQNSEQKAQQKAAPVIVLLLPRRPHALTVVLRSGEEQERVLGMLPPLR
jgi:hypothetical protein